MSKAETALILMSTYNGECYLTEQLDSIRNQTYSNWRLLIRDDGSTDKTINIIQEYCVRDLRIELITDDLGNLKPAQSFAILLRHAVKTDDPFIFFSDQDDVWLAHKLQSQITTLKIMAIESDTNTPHLVYTDLNVVNSDLTIIHPSFLVYENLYASKQLLPALLIHNWITGCALGFNRALLENALPIPKLILMHDWWLALCAAANGEIRFCNEVGVLYRQHERNDIGSRGFISKITFFARIKKYCISIQQRFMQAQELLMRTKLNENKIIIQNFTALRLSNKFIRQLLVIKYKIFPQGYIRTLGFMFILLVI